LKPQNVILSCSAFHVMPGDPHLVTFHPEILSRYGEELITELQTE
jgi:hypothetical protein